jgi:hypothetical protein
MFAGIVGGLVSYFVLLAVMAFAVYLLTLFIRLVTAVERIARFLDPDAPSRQLRAPSRE